MKARMVVIILICFLSLSANAIAFEVLQLRGNGAFLQMNSLDNPLAWDVTFKWALADSGILNDPRTDRIRIPLVMSYSGYSVEELKELIDYCHSILIAVVWEYGPKNTSGLTPKQRRIKAESDLKDARNFANSYGLPFGVITIANPKGAAKQSGIYFKRLKRYADFVMPCLYSQWWKNNPKQTQGVWEDEINLSTVPVIPIVNLYATSAKLTVHELTAQELEDNYSELNPRPQAMAFYGLKYLDYERLEVIREMEWIK